MISLVRIRARDKPSTGVSIGHIYDDVLEGFRYIGRHQTIRTMMVSWIVISFLTRAYTDLLPGFSEDVFHRGSEGLGILLSASGGGALIISIVMAVRGRIDGMARLFVASAVVAVAVLVFVWAGNFWISVAAMVFAGGAIVTGVICAQTLVQSTVEAEFRGRVIAVYLSLAPSAQAVGSFAVGWLAEITSLPNAVAAGALAAMAMIGVVSPKIRRRGPAMEAEAHIPAPAPRPQPAPEPKAAE